MNKFKAWEPFEVVATDKDDSFNVHHNLALDLDMIIFDIIEGFSGSTYKLPYKPLDFT